MKVQNMKIFLISLILLITQVYSLAYAYQELVHEDSQNPKAFTLYNKNVVILSPIIGQNKCLVTEYDQEGREVFSDMPLNISDSGSGRIGAVKDDVFFFGHNQQNLANAKAIDIISKINQGKFKSSKDSP